MNKLINIEAEDGVEIPFRNFLEEMSGTGFIYGVECTGIIEKAVAGELDWAAVDDYFGPIVHEILLESIQDDSDNFQTLALVIKMAFDVLKQKYAESLEVQANE